MRDKRITYAIDSETGLVVSRVGNEVAWPVLNFESMKPENGWAMTYTLEKFEVNAVGYRTLGGLTWTRKLPLKLKNRHREFWGMKPTKDAGKYCPLCGEHYKKDKCKKERQPCEG